MTRQSTTLELVTADQLESMGDIGRCELIDGRIVPMPPTSAEHGEVEQNIGTALKLHVGPQRLGKVLSGEVGIVTKRAPDRVRGADVVYVSKQTWASRTKKRGYLDVAPELVVEVLSPDDRAMELAQKLREYFAIGVKLAWVADPQARTVTVYRSMTDVREFGPASTLTGDEVLPAFEVRVESLFED